MRCQMQMFLSVAGRNQEAGGECSLQNCIHLFPCEHEYFALEFSLEFNSGRILVQKQSEVPAAALKGHFPGWEMTPHLCSNTSCVHTEPAAAHRSCVDHKLWILMSHWHKNSYEFWILRAHWPPAASEWAREKLLNIKSR